MRSFKNIFQSAFFSPTPFSGIGGVFIFLICSMFTLQAQDTILNRNISVEREYKPIIQDAGKINLVPQVLELSVEKTPATYSDFNLPLNVGSNIHTLPAAEVAPERPNKKEGFARIGLGNYLNTLVDFAYPIVNTSDIKLDFSLNQLGTFEAIRLHSTTKATLAFDKIFRTFDLYAGVGGSHEYFKYYGDNTNLFGNIDLATFDALYPNFTITEVGRTGINLTNRTFDINYLALQPTSNTFWRFNSNVGIRSLPNVTDLHYMAEVNYKLFSSITGITENLIHTLAKFSSPSDKNRLGLDLDLYTMMYGSEAIPTFNFWSTYSVLTLNPYYSIERDNWNVRLGLKSSFSFVHGNLVNPSLDVRAEWKAIPKIVALYGGITGDYDVNSLDKISSENPYIFSDLRVNDTFTPYNLVAGIKLKPLYNLLIDAFVNFRQMDNQYFFVNKTYTLNSPIIPLSSFYSPVFSNRFNVIYSSATDFRAGVRLNYNLQNFLNIEFKGTYNGWNVNTEQYAWNKPKYDAQLNVGVKINPNLSVSANAYYEGERYAKLGNTVVLMNDKVDINLGASYSYSSSLIFFAKINNLINNRYQNFYGYDVQGFNLMLGAALTF